LEPLRGLTKLQVLALSDAKGITSVEPLGGLTQLRLVSLKGCTGITDLEPLERKQIKVYVLDY